MNNIESIEQILYINGNLKIKTLVNLYKKKQDDKKRLSNIYSSEYTTKKYQDPLQVKKIVLDIRTFLIFNYYNEQGSGNVFLNQANISRLRDIFMYLSEEMSELETGLDYKVADSPFAIVSNKLFVNPDFLATIDTEGGSIVLKPGLAKWKENDSRGVILTPVIKLYVAETANKVLLDVNAVLSIKEILYNFNLVEQGQNLLILSKLYGPEFSNIKRRPVTDVPF